MTNTHGVNFCVLNPQLIVNRSLFNLLNYWFLRVGLAERIKKMNENENGFCIGWRVYFFNSSSFTLHLCFFFGKKFFTSQLGLYTGQNLRNFERGSCRSFADC